MIIGCLNHCTVSWISCYGGKNISKMTKLTTQGQVIHYQIQRKGEDALFTLSEGKRISHGLDSLVNYYMNEKQTGLQHSLTDWVPGNDWKCWC